MNAAFLEAFIIAHETAKKLTDMANVTSAPEITEQWVEAEEVLKTAENKAGFQLLVLGGGTYVALVVPDMQKAAGIFTESAKRVMEDLGVDEFFRQADEAVEILAVHDSEAANLAFQLGLATFVMTFPLYVQEIIRWEIVYNIVIVEKLSELNK